MNTRYLISIAVIFVLLMVFGFVVHGLLLTPDYQKITPTIMRGQEDGAKHMGFMLIAQLIFAIAFVRIYLRGREDKPWLGQGLRYGMTMAALTVVAKFLIYYAVEQLDPSLVAKQIIYDSIMTTVLGIVVAGLHK
jgi:drug/metabolite transporter (DMT)-like permease